MVHLSSGKTKVRYGLEFDARVPDHQIELSIARFYRVPGYIDGGNVDAPETHFCRAIRMLFTPEQFRLNNWAEKTLWAWCNHTEIILMGCAAASKSHTCGLIALLDWFAAPSDTTSFFSSTTVKALEKRSWSSVLEFYHILAKQGFPGKHSKTKTAILTHSDQQLIDAGLDASDSLKPGIFGVAVMAGSTQDAVSNLIGVHHGGWNGGVRMFADEAQAVKKAYIDARTNLMIGTPDFRIVLLGNPMSREDPLGVMATPIDGWDSVTVEDEQWDTRGGGVLIHFDGHKSPACLEDNGEELHPYMIGPAHIRAVEKRCHGNTQHPDYMTMVRGWIAHASDPDVLFPKAAQVASGAYNQGVGWMSRPTVLAAVDPAFSAKGDDAVIQIAELGVEMDGIARIVFTETLYIPIVDSVDNPPLNQVCRYIWDELVLRRGIDTKYIAVDETATQTAGSALFLLAPPNVPGIDLMHKPLLFNGNKSPSELPLSTHDRRLGNETFATATTEAWYWVEATARFKQLRNLPRRAGAQFSLRKVGQTASRRKGAIALETKEKMRNRGLSSPNEADAVAMLVALARKRLGFTPGDLRFDIRRRLGHGATDGGGFGQQGLSTMTALQDKLHNEEDSYDDPGF